MIDIIALKEIPITSYLQSLGHLPQGKRGNQLVYLSPKKNEKTPSFFVNVENNFYKDFSTEGKGGDIIDLVIYLTGVDFKEACSILEKFKSSNYESVFSFIGKTSTNTEQRQIDLFTIKPLEHSALIQYCELRGIAFSVAFEYLKEIEYTTKNNKKYFGVGFANDKDGFAVRSKLKGSKINIGHQYYTSFIVPNCKSIMIFEGFFNFLSAVVYYGRKPTISAVILNSVSNLNKALPLIQEYTKIYAYMDNDKAGKQALEKLKNTGIEVIDKSGIYQDYNDFNDFLINDKSGRNLHIQDD